MRRYLGVKLLATSERFESYVALLGGDAKCHVQIHLRKEISLFSELAARAHQDDSLPKEFLERLEVLSSKALP